MARIPRSMGLSDLDKVLPRLVDQGLPDGGEFLIADLDGDERTPAIIALLVWHGFLPMAGMGMLLPKIHQARCILVPGEVHIGRKVRRRSKGFRLTVDQAWGDVVRNIQMLTFTTHQGDCWLSDELARAYRAVGDLDGLRRRGVLFHSIELWHIDSGQLVAGEVGYTCGGVYSSCTGFAQKDGFPGAGSVQLAALGIWLARCGFEIWDLGMELEYKLELGCRLAPRAEWAKQIRSLRTNTTARLVSPEGDGAETDRLLLDRAATPPAAEIPLTPAEAAIA